MKRFIALAVVSFILVACMPASEPASSETPDAGSVNPSSPLPSDSNLERGNASISQSELLIRESYPVQIALSFAGELPTPCHQLRVIVSPPDAKNEIHIEIYTVYDPGATCIQVIQPFQEVVETGTFPTGHYTVWLNGEIIGEFDS